MSTEEESATTKLENLVQGAKVCGVVPGDTVEVVQVAWNGDSVITLTYRGSDGAVGEKLLYRDDEVALSLAAPTRQWSFDGDGELFRLAAEARRIQLAHLFDPLLAVNTSSIEPLPHQIEAVYREMLPRLPLRFLLADDPGAGKTIMAGLYLKELMLRGDAERCLIVAPGGLVTQWQDELIDKFGLRFDIVTRSMLDASPSGDLFREKDLLIARLDQLARRDDLVERLKHADWDAVVVDEAHRMSAHWYGRELKETKRYRLGRVLGSTTRHLLLMTATPHAGKEEDFQLFLALLDADRFEGRDREGVHTADTSDLMRRMIKEKLLRFDGRPLFPERRAYTVSYPLSDAELRLYDEVTDYVREEMNRADRLREGGEGRRGNTVGFALTILQRRLASSPEAIYQSLRRRRRRLEKRVEEERQAARLRRLGITPQEERLSALLSEDGDDLDFEALDDLEDEEREELEEGVMDAASAAATIDELRAEIGILERLEELARRVRTSGSDRKWSELSALLSESEEMCDRDGNRRKLIVFTEHRDTLNYLVDRLRTYLGRSDAVAFIHGGVHREQRSATQATFTQDKDCVILVATDAAGEGINLQRAHLVVNYDLPWNPNRIEQRFGRVHRIGQHEVCHMWNLVAENTREGEVYGRLLEKLEEQRRAYRGQVFDVLGAAISGRELADLMVEAIRYGEQPDVRARIEQVIDERVSEGLPDLIRKEVLASDVIGSAELTQIRREMEEAEARRLQPHYIRSFFEKAFELVGGQLREREPKRFEVPNVPAKLRRRDREIGFGAPLLKSYQRVTFDKELTRVDGKPLADLVSPGHPLLGATLDLTLEQHGHLLKQGTVLVDEADDGETPRVLVFLQHSITDARRTRSGGPSVVSRRFEFVEIPESGEPRTGFYAPYLDYRPATADECARTASLLDQDWLGADIDHRARQYAIEMAVPGHLAEVRVRTEQRVRRTREAVTKRLTHEINHWDRRALELDEQVAAGKQPKMNPQRARDRADQLQERLRRRLHELEQEEQLSASPPVVVGAALVVSHGWFTRDGEPKPPRHAHDVRAVERRAVEAVLAAEDALGNHPEEQARNNPGFDVLSETPDGAIRFIEVKGRLKGADTVTVTRNEILTGLNKPEQFILALVEVDPEGSDQVRYLREPFSGDEDTFFDVTSVNYTWAALWDRGGEPG